MSDFLYDSSFFIAVAALVAIAWQAFTADGSSPTAGTPDITDSYDEDDNGWNEGGGDADDD